MIGIVEPFGGNDLSSFPRLAVEFPDSRQLRQIRPVSNRETGEEGRAARRRFRADRPADGNAKKVGLELQQLIVHGGAAVDFQFR